MLLQRGAGYTLEWCRSKCIAYNDDSERRQDSEYTLICTVARVDPEAQDLNGRSAEEALRDRVTIPDGFREPSRTIG
jgi:hypothetical protein